MATDVEVQFFGYQNGLTLSNEWGSLIRYLDTTLVNGIDFTNITAASIDPEGNVSITLYSNHNAVIFQVVELTGFSPVELNQRYRIKAVPSPTQLILVPEKDLAISTISQTGSGKLASLGYEIVFRDTYDVKRVYRAKNPRSEHPFIRVDESLTSPDETKVYTSTYAKYAMVGLLENMEHIDDFENPDVLQLPMGVSSPGINYRIAGTGSSVVRGWSRWYWARGSSVESSAPDTTAPANVAVRCTIIGDKDAFYLVNSINSSNTLKSIKGCGLFNAAHKNDVIPNWFLMTTLHMVSAATSFTPISSPSSGGAPFALNLNSSRCFLPQFREAARISEHVYADLITPDFLSGRSDIYLANDVAALEVPLVDQQKYLRGSLKHVCYNGKAYGAPLQPTVFLADHSMYMTDSIYITGSNTIGSPIFYLGELE